MELGSKRNTKTVYFRYFKNFNIGLKNNQNIYEWNSVHMATAGTFAAVDSLDPIFDDSATYFGRNGCYFPFNVGSELDLT